MFDHRPVMLVVPVLPCGCAHAHCCRSFTVDILRSFKLHRTTMEELGSGGRCVDWELRLCGCCGLLREVSLLIHATPTARHSVTHLQSILPMAFMTPSAFNASKTRCTRFQERQPLGGIDVVEMCSWRKSLISLILLKGSKAVNVECFT